jgi:hypothetical protein
MRVADFTVFICGVFKTTLLAAAKVRRNLVG